MPQIDNFFLSLLCDTFVVYHSFDVRHLYRAIRLDESCVLCDLLREAELILPIYSLAVAFASRQAVVTIPG